MIPPPLYSLVPASGLPDFGATLAPLMALALATVVAVLAVLIAGLLSERRYARSLGSIRRDPAGRSPSLRPAA